MTSQLGLDELVLSASFAKFLFSGQAELVSHRSSKLSVHEILEPAHLDAQALAVHKDPGNLNSRMGSTMKTRMLFVAMWLLFSLFLLRAVHADSFTFFVASDPQFWQDLTDSNYQDRFDRTKATIDRMKALNDSEYSGEVKGVVIAGDLLQGAGQVDLELQKYECLVLAGLEGLGAAGVRNNPCVNLTMDNGTDPIDLGSGTNICVFDGLGNHDLPDAMPSTRRCLTSCGTGSCDPACGSILQWFVHDRLAPSRVTTDTNSCEGSKRIIDTVFPSRPGGPGTCQGAAPGTCNDPPNRGPHYFWDWGDVTFVHINDHLTSESLEEPWIRRGSHGLNSLRAIAAVRMARPNNPIVVVQHMSFNGVSPSEPSMEKCAPSNGPPGHARSLRRTVSGPEAQFWALTDDGKLCTDYFRNSSTDTALWCLAPKIPRVAKIVFEGGLSDFHSNELLEFSPSGAEVKFTGRDSMLLRIGVPRIGDQAVGKDSGASGKVTAVTIEHVTPKGLTDIRGAATWKMEPTGSKEFRLRLIAHPDHDGQQFIPEISAVEQRQLCLDGGNSIGAACPSWRERFREEFGRIQLELVTGGSKCLTHKSVWWDPAERALFEPGVGSARTYQLVLHGHDHDYIPPSLWKWEDTPLGGMRKAAPSQNSGVYRLNPGAMFKRSFLVIEVNEIAGAGGMQASVFRQCWNGASWVWSDVNNYHCAAATDKGASGRTFSLTP